MSTLCPCGGLAGPHMVSDHTPEQRFLLSVFGDKATQDAIGADRRDR